MVTKDFNRFDELAESCGNRYLAVRFIAKYSRSLGKQYHEYHIFESKLIQWVITGRCPYIESDMLKRKIHIDDDKVEDFLSWVTDIEVADEVIKLYKKSVNRKHLLICNNNRLGQSRKSRVNVLLRMLWYSTSIGG